MKKDNRIKSICYFLAANDKNTMLLDFKILLTIKASDRIKPSDYADYKVSAILVLGYAMRALIEADAKIEILIKRTEMLEQELTTAKHIKILKMNIDAIRKELNANERELERSRNHRENLGKICIDIDNSIADIRARYLMFKW